MESYSPHSMAELESLCRDIGTDKSFEANKILIAGEARMRLLKYVLSELGANFREELGEQGMVELIAEIGFCNAWDRVINLEKATHEDICSFWCNILRKLQMIQISRKYEEEILDTERVFYLLESKIQLDAVPEHSNHCVDVNEEKREESSVKVLLESKIQLDAIPEHSNHCIDVKEESREESSVKVCDSTAPDIESLEAQLREFNDMCKELSHHKTLSKGSSADEHWDELCDHMAKFMEVQLPMKDVKELLKEASSSHLTVCVKDDIDEIVSKCVSIIKSDQTETIQESEAFG